MFTLTYMALSFGIHLVNIYGTIIWYTFGIHCFYILQTNLGTI